MLFLHLTFAASIAALPQSATSLLAPSVQLSYAKIVGSGGPVESFKGIPFAQPPIGNLRLQKPQKITGNLGTINAVGVPRGCPQFATQVNASALPIDVARLLNNPLLQEITDSGEDCLTLNVQRPAGTTSGAKLPVVVWIYGGGFETGSTQMYDATQFILNAQTQGKKLVYVAMNYRLGGFGFLPGSEVKNAGVANLGILDQRLALEWVADNIAKFGGDPSAVTIWGESAGSISVTDQMLLYDGNNKYNGNALFRGAIMDSGSIVPADPVDCPKGQVVYNAVVQAAGCSAATDTLQCLRDISYEKFLNAANSVPGIFSYNSVALSYLPRPDGVAITQSPDTLIQQGKYAAVPMIIGDQEDEGTLFSLVQSNVTTTSQLVDYLSTIFFQDATRAQVQSLVDLYPDDASAGSPFRTGPLNNIYPQFKRLAAILGDLTFTITRRIFLQLAQNANPGVPSWSYLNTYLYGTPVLGTFHGSDILVIYGTTPGIPQMTIQSYYYNFITSLNPNTGSSLPSWPQWSKSNTLLNFGQLGTSRLADTFRNATYTFLLGTASSFHI